MQDGSPQVEDRPRSKRSAWHGPGLGSESESATDLANPQDAVEQTTKPRALPLLAPLQKAVGILMKVHVVLDRVAHEQPLPRVDREKKLGAVAPPGELSSVVPRSLERLRLVRRTLDEIVEVAGAEGEDVLVERLLRQHERALRAREQADAHTQQEHQNVEAVRWDVTELEKSMLRSQRSHNRTGIDGSIQRLGEFEKKYTSIEGCHSRLTSDLYSVTQSLSSQLKKNGIIEESTRLVCQARDVAMEENAKANQLLARGENLEVYRKSKGREKIAADADLAEAQAECQAEIARLQQGWSATQAKYTAEMAQLQEEVRSVQWRLDENTRGAEQALSQQSHEWGRCAEDMGKHIKFGMQALETLRTEKVQHLHKEVLQSRQREKDLGASTQRQLEVQLNEVRFQSKQKLKMEELRLREEILAERHSVEVAKKTADIWVKKGDHMREAFRAHAYKSGAYKLAMDIKPARAF